MFDRIAGAPLLRSGFVRRRSRFYRAPRTRALPTILRRHARAHRVCLLADEGHRRQQKLLARVDHFTTGTHYGELSCCPLQPRKPSRRARCGHAGRVRQLLSSAPGYFQFQPKRRVGITRMAMLPIQALPTWRRMPHGNRLSPNREWVASPRGSGR